MSDDTRYSSREARLNCRNEEFYNFITDLRNFGHILPEGTSGWSADSDNCRFIMAPLGEIQLRVSSKTPFSAVVFEGNVLVSNTFQLYVSICEGEQDKANVKLVMEAELNPLLRMMAAVPIERFLETLVLEMEKFDGWKQ